jgi:hypothetical protein
LHLLIRAIRVTRGPKDRQFARIDRNETPVLRHRCGSTNANLVLAVIRSLTLKADVYDRICALADETRAAYPLAMKVFGQDGWDDPEMDEYNVLDPRR